ncbi:alpha/beta hydrolase [Thiorhodococcus minor]|uniref:Alpha/beta hydrolase n=1 Tax=Thiorhodococcus minor TaxID=57489 RepID=A0A6M0JT98_9GAMM|nr:alpha/beta hydrolase [Thiorhodococcus minor]NEV60702.1 alpha/beta hydrolase [Thiorhodococcus minor]
MRHLLLAAALLTGCASPEVVPPSQLDREPMLASDHAVMSDSYRLPLRRWASPGEPKAILLGLHGFNDYGHAFAPLAEELRAADITTYAADQRGFGATDKAGRWHGSERLARDLRELVGLLQARHPKTPVYVAGESMGGAVAMLAAADPPLEISGLILIAPAVWSRDTMPWYQRLALQTAVHTLPWLKLTGESVDISPTDNPELLRAMSADPLVIKETRVDALWGVTELMDAAQRSGLADRVPILLLYGEHDEIIPKKAFCRLIRRAPAAPSRLRLVLYTQGWHILPRDRQGERVRRDILAWLSDPSAPLPSGEEAGAQGERIQRLCRSRG